MRPSRAITRRCSVVVWLAAAVSGSALAGPVRAAEPQPPLEQPSAAWEARLEAASQRVIESRKALEDARAAYQDWHQRKIPRGKSRGEAVAALERAEQEAAAAEAALPEVLEEARRAGAEPGLLRRYEAPPAD
jgi:hypothetical protein